MTSKGNINLLKIDKIFPTKSFWEISKHNNIINLAAQDIYLERVLRQLLERNGFFIPNILIIRFHNELFLKIFFIKIKGYYKYMIRKRIKLLNYKFRKKNLKIFKIRNFLKKTKKNLLLKIILSNYVFQKFLLKKIQTNKIFKKNFIKKKIKKNNKKIIKIIYEYLRFKFQILSFNLKFKYLLKKKIKYSNFYFLSKQYFFLYKKNKLKKINKKNKYNKNLYLFKKLKYKYSKLLNTSLINNYMQNLIKDSLYFLTIQNKIEKKNFFKQNKEFYRRKILLYYFFIKNIYFKKQNINLKKKQINTIYIYINSIMFKFFNFTNLNSLKYKNITNILIKNKKFNIFKQLIIKFIYFYYCLIYKSYLKKNIYIIKKIEYFFLKLYLYLAPKIYNNSYFIFLIKNKKNNFYFYNFEKFLQKYFGFKKIRLQYIKINKINILNIKNYYYNIFLYKIKNLEYFFLKNVMLKKKFLKYLFKIQKFDFFLIKQFKNNNKFFNFLTKLKNLYLLKKKILFFIKKRAKIKILFKDPKFQVYNREIYYLDTLKVFFYLFFYKISSYLLLRFIGFQFRILNRKKQRKFLTFLKRICEYIEEEPWIKSNFAIKIVIKGRIGGQPRKKKYTIQTNKLFMTNTINILEYNHFHAYSRYGTYGINIWLKRHDLFSYNTKFLKSINNISYTSLNFL